MIDKDFYSILGVDRDATPEEIKKAYYDLAMKHHSDHGGDDDEMADINGAYECLSDPTRREQYDASGVDDTRDRAASETRQTFCAICEQLLFERPHLSVKDELKEYLRDAEEKYRRDKDINEEKKRAVLAVLERVIKAPKNNLIEGLARQKLEALINDNVEIEFRITVDRQAVKMFDEYKFKEPTTMSSDHKSSARSPQLEGRVEDLIGSIIRRKIQ